jgi:hypothetical protein
MFMYGIPTPVKEPGEGFRIYRVKFDGRTMTLVEDVAETTGLGLGVHVTITPDAQAFAVADGQKDVIDRATSKVRCKWRKRILGRATKLSCRDRVLTVVDEDPPATLTRSGCGRGIAATIHA